MEIKEINSKEIWEEFLNECEEKTFLDSWNWGEFQKLEGNKIWRMGIYKDNVLIAVFLVVKIKAKRGTFLFIPHGPVVKNFDSQIPLLKDDLLRILVGKTKNLAKNEKAIFLRISPIWERNGENNLLFKKLNFITAPIHIHPEVTWELDLRKSEEEILKEMRKTTRYLIKKSLENKEIEIIKSKEIKDLVRFYEVYNLTAKRHKFVPYYFSYLKNQFLQFLNDNQILIFLGKHKEKIVSSAIIVYWQKIGFYHHGASLSEYNNNKTPVSYLLQWEAIREAKKRGCKKYNFWGIAPEEKDLKHPWYGLSLFKMGFGGEKKEYVKTQDLLFNWRYWLTFAFEKARKIKRRL